MDTATSGDDTMIRLIPVNDPSELWALLPEALQGEFALFPLPPGESAPNDLPSEVPSGVAVVIQTSGSTAKPKRVMITADALRAGAAASAQVIGEGHWLMPLPAHYIAGFQILVRSHLAGTDPVWLNKFSVEVFFTSARILHDRAAENTSEQPPALFTSLVPNQLLRLLESAEADSSLANLLRSFTAILVGGQSLPALLAERAESLGLTIVTTYGSSETSGGCVYDGVPLPGVRVRMNKDLLEISGPMLASGYLADAGRTQQTFMTDRGTLWYRTSDRAEVREGMVRILGRADDVFISGGVKVSVNEVADLVRTLPGLANAEVVTMPDGRWGTVAVIAVDGRPRIARLSLEQVQLTVREKLGDAAIPRQLVYFDEGLPLLDSGKPDVMRIRQEISEQPRQRSEEIETFKEAEDSE